MEERITSSSNYNFFEKNLFTAIEKGNIELVENLIECGADINTKDERGLTPLSYAVHKENETIIEKLIQCGADINTKDKRGLTPLFYTVHKENETIVENLIKCGADINTKDERGLTPLFYSVHKENETIVEKLIQYGADVNATETYGQTVLFYAVREENEKIVQKLVDLGADINATDEDGLTPLFYAVLEDNEEMVDKLIECGADVNATEKHGLTALFCAVTEEKEGMVEKLIHCGADINTNNERGLTPLFYAVHKENKIIINKLIQCGADVNAREKYGQTVLFYAVREEKEEMVQKLVDLGADINATDEDGQIALLYAVRKENQKIVEKLIECGADVNAKDKDSKTALFYAIDKENEKMLRTLIECGADINATNKYGRTMLFYAVGKENEIIVETLIKSGADINTKDEDGATALFYAVRKENEKILEKLIECGADVNAIDEDGATALFYTAKEEVAEKLIECGADINATNKNGRSALGHALMKTNEEMVEKLIGCGADINAKDEEGLTVLFYAVLEENEKILQKLIGCGADINAKDEDGLTVLFYAVRQENEKIVQKIIECGVDINATEKQGVTALFYAVHKENEKIVEKLIDCGADVNATEKQGLTALFCAVTEEKESMVEQLIQCGADINANNERGLTPLFYAVHKENEIIINKLIQCGADINAREKHGQTVLFYAVREENEKMVKKLVDLGADINATDEDGKIALFYAMTHSLSLARYLLDKGATLHLNKNCSVLTFFIEKFFFCLSEKKRKLRDGLSLLTERKEVKGKTILEAIASVAFCKILYFNPGSCDINVESLSKVMRLAIKYTSTLKVTFPVGKNKIISEISKMINNTKCYNKPLIESRAALELPRLLIKLGANPNTTDSDGNTALHHATQLAFNGVTRESIMEICQQLQNSNVSCHITNHENETPLLYCLARTIEKVSNDEEPWPALKTQAAVCRFLVEHGSNVEAKTGSGETVLHLTIKLLQQGFFKRNRELRKDILDVALDLLEIFVLAFRKQDVSTNTQDNSGNTPLHLWAKLQLAPGQDYSSNITKEYTFNKIERTILALVLQDKEQLNSKNKNGENPLHLCRTWAAVELLLNTGANPNDVDSSGSSPLHLAARNNESVHNRGSLYPDILLAPDKFWKTAIKKGLDPWTVDIHNDSLLSVLMELESHDLARALVGVACDDIKFRSRPLILLSFLTAICKDKLPNAQWKKDAAEMILTSTKCPVNGNDNEDSPLHYCCRNIVEASKSLSNDEIKTTVHWCMVKLLRSFGADYRIPEATNKSCLDIAEECPALKDLVMEPIDLDRLPVLIKPWKSVSKTHERCLAKVARHIESEDVESYWYHKDHLARGSFGAVFAGINEKDGREVAIKRIEKIRMQRPEDKREITSLTALADCEQVVRYLCFFEDKHFSYIVLELMEGNLDQFLNTAIQMDTKVLLCQDVAKGVKFLHDHNIIHRDLKPSNILYKIYPKLCLKMADFGLSRSTDSTGSSTSVYACNVGTRCWIAPEVLTSTKAPSKSSDVFACGLVLHYILSVKGHPFAPRTGALQHETETNISNDNKKGWDDTLCPEAAHLLNAMLDGEESKRPSADKALDHPFFWSKKKKLGLLIAVGNQPEFECPRAKVTNPLTAVENDIEASFGTIVKHVKWNDPGYVHMPAIYTEMMLRRKMPYDPFSTVELVRFIRNAIAHVSGSSRATPRKKLLLEDSVFLEYFPDLVMEVYKAVTTHGWDQTREEMKYALQ